MATSPPPISPTPIRSQPGALLGAAKSSHTFKNAAQYEALKRKAIQARLAPAHSALVRQKGIAGQNLKSLSGDLKTAKGGVKGVLSKELSQVKKAALPANNLAVKDAAALKKAMGLKKMAALKATAPSRSALVRQKKLLSENLTAGRSTIGKDMTGIKSVAKQSGAAKSVKKLGAAATKTGASASKGEQRGFGRLLRKVQGS
jgi:hypothetical protein